MSRPSLSERLTWGLVAGPSGCTEWIGQRTDKGYGKIWANGGTRLVHRVVWEIANGPIPPGMQIMHSCDNPPCSNIAHMSLGTAADNQRDKGQKGRGNNQYRSKMVCPAGHPYDPENTYRSPRGARICRTCKRIRGRAYRVRKAARR